MQASGRRSDVSEMQILCIRREVGKAVWGSARSSVRAAASHVGVRAARELRWIVEIGLRFLRERLTALDRRFVQRRVVHCRIARTYSGE